MPKLVVIGAVALASTLFGALAIITPEPQPSTSPLNSVDPVEVANKLGLVEEVVAASGLNGSQTTGLLANLAESATLIAALSAADAAASEAGTALTAAQEAMRRSDGNDGAYEAAATAQAAFDQALAARITARTALFNAATEGLGSEAKVKLAALSAGLVHIVPREFTVLTMTPEEWVNVEAALRAESRASRMGTTLAEGQATLLHSIRTHADVVAAQGNLNNGIGAVESAFASASAPPIEP